MEQTESGGAVDNGYWDWSPEQGAFYVLDIPEVNGGAPSEDEYYAKMAEDLWRLREERLRTPESISNGDVGIGRLNYENQPEMIRARQLAELEGTSANDALSNALNEGGFSDSQREYLADLPATYRSGDWSGGYSSQGGITIDPQDANRPDLANPTLRHEARHAWSETMLSPRERMDWLDRYNLAVTEGRMKPTNERPYFAANPNARATEAYADRPADLPYDMYRFYEPPTTPVSAWSAPWWKYVPTQR